MTREDLIKPGVFEHLLHLLHSIKVGKTIREFQFHNEIWNDIDKINLNNFVLFPSNYKVKPDLIWLPWTDETRPEGDIVLKDKSYGVLSILEAKDKPLPYNYLLDNFKWSYSTKGPFDICGTPGYSLEEIYYHDAQKKIETNKESKGI